MYSNCLNLVSLVIIKHFLFRKTQTTQVTTLTMGSVFSTPCDKYPQDNPPPILALGKSIIPAILNSISRETPYNNPIPKEIAQICVKYIGFMMVSNILNHEEQFNFYDLLIKHHYDKNINSVLTDVKYIKYFDLLYRHSVTKSHTGFGIIQACLNKSNLIIIVHTEYDHIFAVYLHNPLTYTHESSVDSTPGEDTNIGYFLLRSQFVYGNAKINPHLSNKQCPRSIKFLKNSYGHYSSNTREFGSIISNEYKRAQIKLINTWIFRRVYTIYGKSVYNTMGNEQYNNAFNSGIDIVGNEICGGQSFDASTNVMRYSYQLKELEVYQIR